MVHLFSHFHIQFIAIYFIKVPASDIAIFFLHGHTSFFFLYYSHSFEMKPTVRSVQIIETQVVRLREKQEH